MTRVKHLSLAIVALSFMGATTYSLASTQSNNRSQLTATCGAYLTSTTFKQDMASNPSKAQAAAAILDQGINLNICSANTSTSEYSPLSDAPAFTNANLSCGAVLQQRDFLAHYYASAPNNNGGMGASFGNNFSASAPAVNNTTPSTQKFTENPPTTSNTNTATRNPYIAPPITAITNTNKNTVNSSNNGASTKSSNNKSINWF